MGRRSGLAVSEGLRDGRFEAVEGNVGQQGRQKTALHGTSFGRKEGAVVEHSGFEPGPQLAPQAWARREFGEEGVMCDAVERDPELIAPSRTHPKPSRPASQ